MTRHAVAPLSALLLALPMVAAHADGTSWQSYDNYCSTGALISCASVQVIAVNTSEGTTVTLRIRNDQGTNPRDNTGGSSIGYIGFTTPCTIPYDCSYQGAAGHPSATGTATAVGPSPELWDQSLLVGGTEDGTMQYSDLHPAGNFSGIEGCNSLAALASYFQTCGVDGWVEYTMYWSGQFQAQDVGIEWRTYAYAEGDPNNGGGGTGCSFGAVLGPTQCTATVTPEPMTLVLFGTGLAGIGGIVLVRRRKRLDYPG